MFQETLRETTWQMGQNFLPVSMAAPLQYLVITVKVVALQKVSFSDTKNPKTAYSLLEKQHGKWV